MTVSAEFSMKSSSFIDTKPLPLDSGLEAGNKAPQISWSNAPQGTKSFALIMDDPDAPSKEPWVHWVVFNIPASQQKLDAAQAIQGSNSYGTQGYGGPRPPSGTHRYYFTLYALDTLLPLKASSTKKDLETAMKGHILGTAKIMGTYAKK